jgi:hypothetical protein
VRSIPAAILQALGVSSLDQVDKVAPEKRPLAGPCFDGVIGGFLSEWGNSTRITLFLATAFLATARGGQL